MNPPLKSRTDLIPPQALLEVGLVLAHGAEKHDEAGQRGWTVRLFGQDYGALLRHALAWWGGEDLDPHSGCSHLAHVAARALILLGRLPASGPNLDDRPGGRG